MTARFPKLPLSFQRRGPTAPMHVAIVDADGEFWAAINRTDLPEAEVLRRGQLIVDALTEFLTRPRIGISPYVPLYVTPPVEFQPNGPGWPLPEAPCCRPAEPGAAGNPA